MNKTFTITLAAPKGDDDAKAVRRLRAFLKASWRSYGLRCVRCEPEEAPSVDGVAGDDSEVIR